jgi:hypothetical protein
MWGLMDFNDQAPDFGKVRATILRNRAIAAREAVLREAA